MLLISCSPSNTVLGIRNSDKLEIIALPLDMHTKYAIRTEEFFDGHFNELKDTISVSDMKLSLQASELLEEYKQIDMRAKGLIRSSNGELKKIYLSRTGLLMYQEKIYKAPDELMSLIRSFDKSRDDGILY